jgi:hypothetical protein
MTVTKLVHSCFFGNGESLKFNRCDIFASTLVATRATTNFRRIESISEAEKKEDLAELEAALKNASPFSSRKTSR